MTLIPIYVRLLHAQKMREVRVKGWSNLRSVNWSADGKGLFVVTTQKGYEPFCTWISRATRMYCGSVRQRVWRSSRRPSSLHN